jgi:hypothetical protein
MIGGGTFICGVYHAIDHDRSNVNCKRAILEGIPGVMDWQETTPLDVLIWAKKEGNAYGAQGVRSIVDYLEDVPEVEDWHPAPKNGPQHLGPTFVPIRIPNVAIVGCPPHGTQTCPNLCTDGAFVVVTSGAYLAPECVSSRAWRHALEDGWASHKRQQGITSTNCPTRLGNACKLINVYFVFFMEIT